MEHEVNAKRNEDGNQSETEHEEDEENMGTSPRRRQKRDSCCNEGVLAIIFTALTLMALLVAWVTIEFFKAWGKRGSAECD